MEIDGNKTDAGLRRRRKKDSYRTEARELAVQMMYQSEMTGEEPLQVVETFLKMYRAETEDKPFPKNGYALRMRNKPGNEVFQFAKELFFGAYAKKTSSDELVALFLRKDWTLDRLSCTVKNIFRLALYELIDTGTPPFAVLTDYLNLACAFVDEKTAVFVNGLLEKVRVSIFNAEA
jgi:N utilization substance protein B